MNRIGRVAPTLLAVVLAWLALALAPGGPSSWAKDAKPHAAQEAKLPEPLTKESIRELVSRLSDEEVRGLLIQQLDRAAAPPKPADEGLAGKVGRHSLKLRDGLREMGEAAMASPRNLAQMHARLVEGKSPMHGLIVAGVLALALVLGGVAEQGGRRLTARHRAEVEGSAEEGLTARIARLALRLGLDVLDLVVFAVVAGVVLLAVFLGDDLSRHVALAVLEAVVYVRAWALLSRFVLAPQAPAKRLLPLGDGTARVLHRNLLALVIVWAAGMTVGRAFALLGAPRAAGVLLSVVLTLFALALVLKTLWAVRDDVGALIRGSESNAPLRKLIADFWPVAFGVFVLVIGVARIVGAITQEADLTGAGMGSLAVVIVLPIVDYALCQILHQVIRSRPTPAVSFADALEPAVLAPATPSSAPPASPDATVAATPTPTGTAPLGTAEGQGSRATVAAHPVVTTVESGAAGALHQFPESAQRFATSYEPVLRKAIHIVLTVLGFLFLADLWNIDLFALAERGLGGQIAGASLGIGITVLLAYLLWELIRTAIDRRMEAEAIDGPGVSRLRTLLPLFRITLQITLAVMATLSVLAALGVNILPLLAGAGVIGVAIGFGSQTLVRDIVSGAFFLMDDAFRLGEYIEVGDAKGVVERITIRSLFLRHHRGALNILPYGEIKRLRNTSRDWMIMIMEFRLEADTDIRKVKKVLKRIGEEISGDPELSKDLLAPLKSQGVMGIEDGALVVRAKFTARPGNAPFMIRREAYTRILAAFAEAGIHFANRQVTVFVPPGTSEQAVAQSVAAAAAAAADEAQKRKS